MMPNARHILNSDAPGQFNETDVVLFWQRICLHNVLSTE